MTLPAGCYAENYAKDQALIRTLPQQVWFMAFMILICSLPFWGGGKIVGIMNIIAIMVIAVVGLQITIGYAGQINIGQSAFMGVGAYICGALTLHFHMPIWVTIPAAGMSAALFGSIFGLAAARIKGFYMALTTLAAQFIFHFIMMKLPEGWFGQSKGLRLDPVSLFGLQIDSDTRMYFLIIGVAILMVYGAWGLVRSKTGRALVATRDNDNAAEIIGINISYYKALAFFIGAFYAGVSGSLWAYYIRYIQSDQFTLWMSVWYVGMLIVGGMGTIQGAIIGTVIVQLLQELISYSGTQLTEILPAIGGQLIFSSMNMLLGGIIILFVIFEPRGVVHRWNIVKESYRIWPFPH